MGAALCLGMTQVNQKWFLQISIYHTATTTTDNKLAVPNIYLQHGKLPEVLLNH